MSRLPQTSAIGLIGRPLEFVARELADDRAGGIRLLGDARRAAVEFQEQRRRLAIAQVAVTIDRRHLHFVEQFEPRHRDAGGEDRDRCLHSGIDVGERAHGSGHGIRLASQSQRHFGDEAERSL